MFLWLLVISQKCFLKIVSALLLKELLMTWGVDGKVCLWDSYSVGEVLSPMCTLISHSNYPIYALDITEYGSNSIPQADENQRVHVAVGGGADGGFLGVPAYLYGI